MTTDGRLDMFVVSLNRTQRAKRRCLRRLRPWNLDDITALRAPNMCSGLLYTSVVHSTAAETSEIHRGRIRRTHYRCVPVSEASGNDAATCQTGGNGRIVA